MALDSLNREKIKVAVIMSSARPGRFCDTVTSWLMSARRQRPYTSVAQDQVT